MKPFAYLLFMLAGLGACRSYEGPTMATGQVLDSHTSQPVAHATVQVVSIASGLGAGGTAAGSSFPTDAQGRFSFTFDAQEQANYTLLASTTSGYTSGYGDAPVLHAGRHNEDVVVRATAPAWVRIVCLDDPPASSIGLTTAGYDGMGDNQTIGPGNFTFVRPIGSNADRGVYCRLLDEQGLVKEFRQPVNVASFDTATVLVHF